MHGAHTLSKNSMPKYPSDLAFMQANSKLGKITASHFWVLNTQSTNENMPDMFPMGYLNENLRYFNENLASGKQEPLVQSYTV